MIKEKTEEMNKEKTEEMNKEMTKEMTKKRKVPSKKYSLSNKKRDTEAEFDRELEEALSKYDAPMDDLDLPSKVKRILDYDCYPCGYFDDSDVGGCYCTICAMAHKFKKKDDELVAAYIERFLNKRQSLIAIVRKRLTVLAKKK